MSTVQRWLTTLGDAAIEAYPPLAVLAGWVAVLTGQTVEAQRWAAIIDASSFDLVPADGSASFDSARAMLRVSDVRRRSRADDGRRPPCRRPGATVEPLARPSALPAGGGAPAHRRRRPGRGVLFAEASAVSVTNGNTDVLVLSESELDARWPWIGADGRRRPSTSRSSLAIIDRHRVHDYALSVLAFAAAARLAVHRGDLNEANRQLTPAMRARPTLHDRAAVSRGAGSAADGQGVLGARRPGHRSSPVARDRRHPARTGPRSASSSTRSRPSETTITTAGEDRQRPAGRPSPRQSSGCSRTCRPT